MADPSLAAYLPFGHDVHALTFDSLEYLPTAHAVQMLAPVLVPVFVIEPAAHCAQSLTSFEPVVPLYVPGAQSVHAATFDAVEYLPTAHAVHVVAPVPVPTSVIEPAAQSVHVESVDFFEYLPAAQALHAVAAAHEPLLVIEPAAHSEQYDLPRSD